MKKTAIILIGMSGVGKTTVGNELSKVLDGYEFVDIDEKIEKYANKSIPEIFEEFGEQFFRVLEKDIIKKVLKNDTKQVISLGGGAFEDEFSRKFLLDNGMVIYLKASAKDIYDRLVCYSENVSEFNRPLLKDLSVEKIEKIMSNRIKNYEKAHITIDTTGKNQYNVVEELLELCRQ